MAGDLEIERTAFIETNEELAPVLRDAHEQDLGKLSISGQHLSESIAEYEKESVHADMLKGFASALPTPNTFDFTPGDQFDSYTHTGYTFHSRELYIAKALVGSTIWIRNTDDGDSTYIPPHVIVGQRPNTSSRKYTDVLLLNTMADQPDQPWGLEITARTENMQEAMSKANSLTEEDYDAMLNDGSLEISAQTPNSMTAIDNPFRFNTGHLGFILTFIDTSKAAMKIKYDWRSRALSKGASEDLMESYDVIRGLEYLSREFGLEATLSKLFQAAENRTKPITDTNITTLNG